MRLSLLAILLLLFTLLPLVELALLLLLADLTSWWVSLLVVIVTGVTGSLLAKWQGLRAWRRIREELAAGRLPGEALLDGAMILLAGVLLVTPGMITDLVGITLLIPPLRRLYRAWLLRWLASRFRLAAAQFTREEAGPGHSTVIDSYVVERREDEPRPS